MILAIAADALQIFVFPLFAEGAVSPADDVLDLAVAAVLVNLLGPEHASAKSHVQIPRDSCITTGAAIHARIVHYKEVSHDSENATASTPILGEN
jgi:hypothetical protein